jgi:hypothetical protein
MTRHIRTFVVAGGGGAGMVSLIQLTSMITLKTTFIDADPCSPSPPERPTMRLILVVVVAKCFRNALFAVPGELLGYIVRRFRRNVLTNGWDYKGSTAVGITYQAR